MSTPDTIPVTLAVTSVACSCDNDCGHTLRKGDQAFWVKGQGLLHPECSPTPIDIPEALQVALTAVRTALPGIRDAHVSVLNDQASEQVSINVNITKSIGLTLSVPKTDVRLCVHTMSLMPTNLSRSAFIVALREDIPNATEGKVLTWVDEHLVPVLFDHTQNLRAEALSIEQALGFMDE